ncbi:MAG: Gfo/Idh/MocA family oxidoreductase [Ginsengibacter sp.]
MLKGAIIGTGFWPHYQAAAWKELQGVEVVAAYNRTISKARVLAKKFAIPAVYDDAQLMLEKEQLDFVDIITDVATHHPFTLMAAQKGVNVICQKPMAPSVDLAANMLEACNKAGVMLFIHENFRWQAPVRALKKAMDSGFFKRGKTIRKVTKGNYVREVVFNCSIKLPGDKELSILNAPILVRHKLLR